MDPSSPSIAGESMGEEIALWEAVAREPGDAAVRAEAFRRLALLLSHPDNPAPNYPGALEALKEFGALDPEAGGAFEIRRLEAVLSELGRCERRGERRREVADLLSKEEQEVRRRLEALRRDSRGMAAVLELLVEEGRILGREKEELQRRNQELAARQRELEELAAGLAKENQELKETLERLKTLDLQLERLRTGAEPQ